MYKQYKFEGQVFTRGIMRIDGENVVTSIPFVDGNTDYEEYKKWLAEGNTPEPADQSE